MPPLVGNPLVVPCAAPVPLMSAHTVAVLVALLSFVGLLGLRRARSQS
ncbi:MAG: hypothetical protein HY270_05425 [Deltaproteobacteria bacterium]|nr:hypothetical protein [Deltaproteobacteria bacterium]